MARSAKTDHVMNLVGAEPVKRLQPPAVQEMTAVKSKTAESSPDAAEKAVRSEPPKPEAVPQQNTPDIKAVVPEVINQELGNVAKRFHLKTTDSNLWELTRAALEGVRPEFSFGQAELEEKAEKIRSDVIMAMTKAAFKLMAKERNGD